MQTNPIAVLDALGDPTRRSIIERLGAGPQPVGVLAASLPVTRPAVSQHLKVLKAAGLVVDIAVGTRRVYRLDPDGLAAIRDYFDHFWQQALEGYAAAASSSPAQSPPIQGGAMTDFANLTELTETTDLVRRSVTVSLTPDKAFELFTSGINRWWPREGYAIGEAPLREVVLEPREGGRWYELDTDSTECEWGRVLTWEPPTRVVLSWQIDIRWQFDPATVTELEIRFTAQADGRTLVELGHSRLESYGDRVAQMREAFSAPSGWQGLLDGFADVADVDEKAEGDPGQDGASSQS